MIANRKETQVIITLELNELEASMLKAIMQNPLSEDESQSEYDFRNQLFEELKEALNE